MGRKHQHKAIWTKGPLPFVAPVAEPDLHNPRAHGGARYIDKCRCGATREWLTSAGGNAVERGPWREA